MEKTSIQHGEISVQKLEGEFSILNGEKWSGRKKKDKQKKRFITRLKKFEWRNLHSEWRFLNSGWRNSES